MEYRTPDTGQGEHAMARLLTAQQAAEQVGVHERTIRRAIGRGDLQAIKRHGVFRIAPHALQTWFEHRSNDAPSPHSTEPATTAALLVPPRQEPLGRLIGRERELEAATGMLAQEHVRLLTLTGTGGIGKTRFGLEVANHVHAHFPDGVYIVPLAEVSSAELVPAAIVEALGLPDHAASGQREALFAALKEAQTLIVLDNFEHVLDAAPIVSDLLRAGPRVKVLVTSRSLLRVRGEFAFPLPPLELPGAATDLTAQDATGSPAVQLFMERARAVSPTFQLTADNAAVIVEICHHMGGLPLAIELAASQTNVLPPHVLLARIEAKLPLPFSGPRDAPDRQRTIANAIEWSYALLSPDEQWLFRRLSPFIGGFPLDAVDHVSDSCSGMRNDESRDIAPAQHFSTSDPLAALMTLVDSSLVQREVNNHSRFTMLEPIRAYALNQLTAHAEFDEAHDSLADWCMDLVTHRPLATHLDGGEQYIMRLDNEQANFRRSLAWLYNHRDVDRLARLVVALGSYWYERNQYHEGHLWTERVVRMSAGSAGPDRGMALVYFGFYVSILGDPAAAQDIASDGISLLRNGIDPDMMSIALIFRGGIAIQAGDYVQADASLREALDLARAIPNEQVAAAISARAMSNLGVTSHGRNDLDGAAAWHDRALRTCREHGYLRGMSRALCDLADVARDRGDYTTSLSYYRESLAVLGERSDVRLVLAALEGAAMAAAVWKQGEQAARLLGAAARLRDVSRVPTFMSTDRSAHDRTLQATRTMLDEATFDQLFEEGRRLTQAASITEAMAVSPPPDCTLTDSSPNPVTTVLSARELDVLTLLARGLRDREIADALFISVRTVEGHVARILTKLGVTSRTAAASAAIGQGFIAADSPRRP
jgi:excisionase family DNA binding protein